MSARLEVVHGVAGGWAAAEEAHGIGGVHFFALPRPAPGKPWRSLCSDTAVVGPAAFIFPIENLGRCERCSGILLSEGRFRTPLYHGDDRIAGEGLP